MPRADPPSAPASRRTRCARCGIVFECGLSADCWCAAEPYRVPMTRARGGDCGADCLCRACLREAASLAGVGRIVGDPEPTGR